MAVPTPPLPGAVPEGAALGLLETHGLVAAIEAADAMLKAADVRLVRQQRTVPALVTHVVTGETAAVQAAVDAGAAAAARVGKVAGKLVIPRPADGLMSLFGGPKPPAPAQRAAATDDYEDRTVRDLRQLARDRDDDRLRGRAIAQASKDELIAFLRGSDR
jgi:microcompartment protein CcmL/EutN